MQLFAECLTAGFVLLKVLHVLLVPTDIKVVDSQTLHLARPMRVTGPVLLDETEIGIAIRAHDLAIDMTTVIVETGIDIVTVIMIKSPTLIAALVRGLGHPDVGNGRDLCRDRGPLVLGCRGTSKSLFRWWRGRSE